MRSVLVKSKHKADVVFGTTRKVKPGETIEVSLFEYNGALANDPMWELVQTETKEAKVDSVSSKKTGSQKSKSSKEEK